MADPVVANKLERGEIFGLSYKRITISMIREIMVHYREPFTKGWLKPIYWEHLQSLESGVRSRERKVIARWVASDKRHRPAFEDHIRDFEEERAYHQTAGQTRIAKTEKPQRYQTRASKEARPAAPKTIECEVCSEDRPVHLFPKEKITDGCEHEPRVCLHCLGRHIESEIQRGAWAQLSCPQCPERLDFAAVQKFASKENFTRYDNLSAMALMRHDSNFMMCLGPNCGSGQIHSGGDAQPIMTCSACYFKTCFTHKLPWHSGQTCAGYDERQQTRIKQEAASAKFLAEKTKICPNSKCGLHIEKRREGCDHMTCHQCHFQFCWICLAPYDMIRKHGNHHHAEDCRHYRSLHSDHQPGDIEVYDESGDEDLGYLVRQL